MPKDPLAVELGRRGGIARAKKLKSGAIPITGAAARGPIPTKCRICSELQPSARLASVHCKVGKKQ